MVKPIFEDQATDEVKTQYSSLKNALNIPKTPLFFCYIGAFPEYLIYITSQLVINLKHPTFLDLVSETKNTVISINKETLKKSNEINEWLKRFKFTPSYYSFQNDLHKIISVNISLTFIFIALREAIKGWALAAKKIAPVSEKKHINVKTLSEQDFLYDDLIQEIIHIPSPKNLSNKQSSSLVKKEVGLEKQLLPEYLDLCRFSFNQELKQSYFWTMRLGFERLFLLSLQRMPELIFSPVNVVYRLADKYPNFTDLLYLLSEHFPTYAMHRMIYSAYLLE